MIIRENMPPGMEKAWFDIKSGANMAGMRRFKKSA
jgi:hypothetical protein